MAQGVALLQFIHYCNFARHLDRLCRRYSGRQLAIQVQLVIEKWQGYGMKKETLTAIVKGVIVGI